MIYSSTTIHKGDYLTSAGIVHGIEVVYEDGVLEVTLPGLLPKRKQRQNTEFLLDPFYFSLEQYAKEHPMPHFSDCVVCFTQVYDQCLPTRRIRDYDNLEEKQLLDVSPPSSWLTIPACSAMLQHRCAGRKGLYQNQCHGKKAVSRLAC